MAMDPARHVTPGFHRLDGERMDVQAIDGRESRLSLFRISEVSDHIDEVADKRCRVEIGRRKHLAGIGVNLALPPAVMDDHIVVDAEVQIVEILVFPRNFDEAAIREPVDGCAEPLIAPDRVSEIKIHVRRRLHTRIVP